MAFSPDLERYGLLEFDSIDAIIDAGYRYAQERIRELKMDDLKTDQPTAGS